MKPIPRTRRASRRRRHGKTSRWRMIALSTSSVVVAGLLTGLSPTQAVAANTGSTYSEPSDVTGSTYSGQQLQWGACDWFPAHLTPVPECATITVPRDWRDPGEGEDLSIAISRIKATDAAHRKGILFTNPGGPSGSGISLSYVLGNAQPKVAAQYDIIGMDPRGVGRSTRLICDVDTAAADAAAKYGSRDLSAAAFAARHGLLKGIADGCATNPLTPYINTWQTTHDMDLIRAVLDEQKLNYVGYSYGTWLGAKYAALFPTHAGKLVLDSNTNWMGDMADAWELMPMAFQRHWDKQFVPWTNRITAFNKDLGTTPAQVNAAYEQARAVYGKYADSPQGPDFIDAILRQVLYDDQAFAIGAYILGQIKVCLVENQDWSQEAVTACVEAYTRRVAKDISDQLNDESAAELTAAIRTTNALLTDPQSFDAASHEGLLPVLAAARQATGETMRIGGVYYAVRCGDGGNWHNTAWWDQMARHDGPKYPIAAYALSSEVCPYWTLPTQELPDPDPRRLGPLVAVQAEFDSATAFENLTAGLRHYPARMLAVDDAGTHGQYGIRGYGCVNDIVNAYLLDDVTPAARTVCASPPLMFEDRVYPQTGPVDDLGRPRPSRVDHVPDHVREAVRHLIW
ncbi:alpha/beta fold hydrolase [Kribbella sp. NPDC023855]|uniref:alpha/beta fold hydrolase n=1 Tax=Kribbella sp. NPDC023855 TaxID=3154698 RepID=UPI0033D1D4E7